LLKDLERISNGRILLATRSQKGTPPRVPPVATGPLLRASGWLLVVFDGR